MPSILDYTKELVEGIHSVEPAYDVRVRSNQIIVSEPGDGRTYTIELNSNLFHVHMQYWDNYYHTIRGTIGQVIDFILE